MRVSTAKDKNKHFLDSNSKSRHDEHTYPSWSRSRQRAPYQENITESELEEEVPRRLESIDPLAPKSVIHFNYITEEYETAPPASPTIHLLHLSSAAILKTSPEILELDDFDDFYTSSSTEDVANKFKEEKLSPSSHEETERVNHEDSENDNTKAVRAFYKAERAQRERKVPNAFNFCDEASQTNISDTLFKSKKTQTTPPPSARYSYTVRPSAIFDAYAADFEKQEKNKRGARRVEVKPRLKEKLDEKKDENYTKKLNLMERVIGQNIFDEILFDFRYFEDPADEFRSEGRLLPLWRFSLPNQILPITDMEWSHHYYDLLAASFGLVDSRATETCGALVLFSLKNPLYLEYLRLTESPALCISLHPSLSSLVVVGMYNGHVAVYDCASQDLGAQYVSHSNNKHMNAVYSIKWQGGDALNFYSASSDGFVKSWELMTTCLEMTIVRKIIIPLYFPPGPESVQLHIRGWGLHLEFDPVNKNVFYIGTVAGIILKCNASHVIDSLFAYRAHKLPVNSISFNSYVPHIFLSCSADWNVKLWEDERSEPLLVFDLGNPVADVKWAPYTSTVFAAVTSDGCVHVFDLNINRYRPIYKQHAVSSLKDNEPTRLIFNRATPMLVVGEKRGRMTFLKLSPNLRIPAKASKKYVVEQKELEVRKLLKVLSFMKPKVLEPPEDVPSA